LVLLVALKSGKINRSVGIGLVIAYLAYLAMTFLLP
jgi:Ca2+/Na+ antiporter